MVSCGPVSGKNAEVETNRGQTSTSESALDPSAPGGAELGLANDETVLYFYKSPDDKNVLPFLTGSW